MEPASPPESLLTGFIQHADLMVQIVVAALLLGSVASWAIIFEKIVSLQRLGAAVRRIERLARDPGHPPAVPDPLLLLLLAARDEAGADAPPGSDLGARRAAAMRAAYGTELRRRDAGLPFLATLASAAPFIGLFGTVWGIMQSFSSIAAAKDTSLTVVAPGIAEALFATAIGLGAAIPAVIAYNLCRARLQGLAHRLQAAAATLAKTPAVAAEGRR
jgi:biopolymer transport protein ExbB/TolQ